MPVIINDFEVVVEEPAVAPAEPTAEAPATPTMTPQDIEHILAWLNERQLRLVAD
jgi:hypothetical protein